MYPVQAPGAFTATSGGANTHSESEMAARGAARQPGTGPRARAGGVGIGSALSASSGRGGSGESS